MGNYVYHDHHGFCSKNGDLPKSIGYELGL